VRDSMQQFATNKHVLITGGSEGLGLALAKQLVAHNARVSLVARTKSKLEAAAQAVATCTPNQDRSSQVSWHPADVTNYQQVSETQSSDNAASPTISCEQHALLLCRWCKQCRQQKQHMVQLMC
jgi:short-subunit dehydrogenase